MSDSNVIPISDEQANDLRFRLDCKVPVTVWASSITIWW
jgi:hypothetical protein